MVKIKKNPDTHEIQQKASHILFVEGETLDSLDPKVFDSLLGDTGIGIRPLGPCRYVQSASEALHRLNPNFYFIIDRDHRDEAYVNKLWANFPDPETYNLLVWRRRELENYFIIPEYIIKSDYFDSGKYRVSDVRKTIIKEAGRRIYFDAANLVISEVREKLKSKWIEFFKPSENIKTFESAKTKLTNHPAIRTKLNSTRQVLSLKNLETRLDAISTEMLGGKTKPEFGHGTWQIMIKGKPIFPVLVTKYFKVKDNSGKDVQGKRKQVEVVKDLLRKPLKDQPNDFIELHRLILDRMSNS